MKRQSIRKRLTQVLGSQEVIADCSEALRRFWSPAGPTHRNGRGSTVVDLGRWIATRASAP